MAALWPLYGRFCILTNECDAVSDLEQWERLVCLLIVSAENLSKPACSEHIDHIQKVFLYSQVEVGAPPGVTAILCYFMPFLGTRSTSLIQLFYLP